MTFDGVLVSAHSDSHRPAVAHVDAGEVARFARIAKRPRLIRVLGDPRSDRTGLALDLIALPGSSSKRGILVLDTLGQGAPAMSEALAGYDLFHVPGTDFQTAFSTARQMLSTDSLAAIVIDDILGLDTGPGASGAEALQRMRLIQRSLQTLSSACVSKDVTLIVVDRISPMGVLRTPLGFYDMYAEPCREVEGFMAA